VPEIAAPPNALSAAGYDLLWRKGVIGRGMPLSADLWVGAR